MNAPIEHQGEAFDGRFRRDALTRSRPGLPLLQRQFPLPTNSL